MTETQKPHISASQLGMFTRCGIQYKRRYLDKDIIPPGIALIEGSAVHKGAEENFRQKIESRIDLPKKNVTDIVVTSFEDRIKTDGILLSPEEEKIGKQKVIGQTKDEVVKLADVFCDAVAPNHQPVLVEEKQTVEFKNSDHDLVIRLDLINDQEEIVDLKTKGKTPTQDEVDRDEQLTIYALGYHVLKGKPPKALKMESIIKTKNPKADTKTTHRIKADYLMISARLENFMSALKKGAFMPAPSNSWVCSERFCGYWRTCEFGGKYKN